MIDYSLQYFGKGLHDLSYDDIENFFSERKEESNKIEFKSFNQGHCSFNEGIKGVIRGICAFLNSDGGILIWGSPQKQVEEGGEGFYQGSLHPVNQFRDKDRLISKISDSISPLPVRINVEILEKQGKWIYIFEIQKSEYSPHQYKNIYLARLDGQTKPAPHYLVEALMRKITFPNIQGYITIGKISFDRGFYNIEIQIEIINKTHLQNEYDILYTVYSEHATFNLGEDHSLKERLKYDYDNHQYSGDNNSILYFGDPIIDVKVLTIKLESLTKKYNNQIDIKLVFGGKSSPLKYSEYKLDISRGGKKETDNNDCVIIEKRENKQLGID